MILIAWTVLHVYVVIRAASLPAVRRRLSAPGLAAVTLAAWSLLVIERLLARETPALELVAMTWMATLFLIAICLLAVDLVTGFGLLLRRRVASLRGWALIAGAALATIAMVQGLRPPVVRDHEVLLDALPARLDGTVLMVVSDLHLGDVLGARWLAGVVERIAALEPDAVLLAGDVFEGHGTDARVLTVLARLSAPLGVWGVLGNHDRRAVASLEAAGIELLRDRSIELAPGLVLAGVDDKRASPEAEPALGQVLAARPPGAAVLLSHRAAGAERAAAAGVGLMLAGHTHGGQIWPFGLLVRTTTPWVAGRFRVDRMTLLVSRGAGTWGPRMRLWAPGEILRVTLRAGSAAPPGV